MHISYSKVDRYLVFTFKNGINLNSFIWQEHALHTFTMKTREKNPFIYEVKIIVFSTQQIKAFCHSI